MSGIRCTCAHGRMMDAYDTARQVWWDEAERVTSLYPTELAEYKRDNPAPLLRDFMKQQGSF